MRGFPAFTRRFRRVAPVALLLAFGAVHATVPASAGSVEGPAAYRLDLDRRSGTGAGSVSFVASLERSVDSGRSWSPATGEAIEFAFVGEGRLVGIEGEAVQGMICTTPASGSCTVRLESGSPGSSMLAAFSAGGTAASASLGD